MTIIEEIKFALECANEDIDLMPKREEYMRGYLGGQLSIVRIIENHFGKFINDDEIYKEDHIEKNNENVLEELKSEIYGKGKMHIDGEYYITESEVAQIIDKYIKELKGENK